MRPLAISPISPRDRRWKPVAAHQNQMDAHVQSRILMRQFDCVIERPAGRHQRGCSEDALPVGVNNTVVDVARVAEVVGVRDQILQFCRLE